MTGRGGAGKTTTTSNLGVYFSGRGIDTLLIDGDLFLPKLSLHFGIDNPAVNVHSILRNPRINPFDAIYRDPRTGVHLVPGSPNIYDVLHLDHSHLVEIVSEYSKSYNVVIVDSPVGIPFDALPTFNIMEYQIVVLELERSPIYSLKVMLENELLKLKAIGDEFGLKVGVVINKVREARRDIDDVVDFIEEVVGVPVLGVVALDDHVPLAINYGMPVLAKFPRAQASKDFRALGENVYQWLFKGEGGSEKRRKLRHFLYDLSDVLHRITHWS
ncbi:MinD/ParA family protein [Thermococcus sp. Bubb.Bath]|uniref:MinD/ParA family ATP-binding protein n=1 Tax=Thermococcus sp. Bubb.Bath TaxID=1638242 RepID=UPI0031838EA0